MAWVVSEKRMVGEGAGQLRAMVVTETFLVTKTPVWLEDQRHPLVKPRRGLTANAESHKKKPAVSGGFFRAFPFLRQWTRTASHAAATAFCCAEPTPYRSPAALIVATRALA